MPKIKSGDIVRFNASARNTHWWKEWVELNGDGPFLACDSVDDGCNFRLTHPDGRPFVWGQTFGSSNFGTDRVGAEWLIRNEFLTAVHKAKNGKIQRG